MPGSISSAAVNFTRVFAAECAAAMSAFSSIRINNDLSPG